MPVLHRRSRLSIMVELILQSFIDFLAHTMYSKVSKFHVGMLLRSSVLQKRKLPIGEFVHEVYHIRAHHEIYESSYNPVDSNDLYNDPRCGPCGFRKPRGCPQKECRGYPMCLYIRPGKRTICHQESHDRQSRDYPGYGNHLYYPTNNLGADCLE